MGSLKYARPQGVVFSRGKSGQVPFRLERESVTHIFLLKNCATPTRRRRASVFRIPPFCYAKPPCRARCSPQKTCGSRFLRRGRESVRNIFLAVARKISRPWLAPASADAGPAPPFESLTQHAPHVAPLRSMFTAFTSAEREGFEPSRTFRPCRFSKPVLSTTQPPLLHLRCL